MSGAESRGRVAVAVLMFVILAVVAGFSVRFGREEAAARVTAAEPVTVAPGPRLLMIREGHLATAGTPAVRTAGREVTGRPRISSVQCVRAYAAAGTAVCLRQDTPWAYSLHVLDQDLRERSAFPVPGLPNRARVSPSGRMVAWTSFVGGDSYEGGNFATRTGILDTVTGRRTDSLESYTVILEGRRRQPRDRNFWGVTFADDRRFYATMSAAGRRWLVAGDVGTRQVRTLLDNVECPSLSPDGTRLAFKQAVGGDPGAGWRLAVLDLATMTATQLAETRSVDDQAAWLSGEEVAYTLRDDEGTPTVWSVPAGGGGSPRPVLGSAESPASLDLKAPSS